MRRQIHVAIPGEHRPPRVAHRQAGQPVVDHRHRLHERTQRRVGGGDGAPSRQAARLGGGEEGGVERQHAGAVRAGALGEQDQVVPSGQAHAHVVAFPARGAALPADEDGPAQARHLTHDRPAPDIVLRDEAGQQVAAQHGHVEPGGMVRRIHHRTRAAGRRLADDPHLHAHQLAGRGPVGPCEALLAASRQHQHHRLDETGNRGPAENDQAATDHPQPAPGTTRRRQPADRLIGQRRRADPPGPGFGRVRNRLECGLSVVGGVPAKATRSCLHRADIA